MQPGATRKQVFTLADMKADDVRRPATNNLPRDNYSARMMIIGHYAA